MQTPVFTIDVTPSHPYAVTTVLEISSEALEEFFRAPYADDPQPFEFKDCPKSGPPNLNFDWTYVPVGLTKKEYNALLKENREKIRAKREQIREAQSKMENIDYQEFQIETFSQIEKNINKRLRTIDIKFNNSNLLRAKSYPIENIIDVKHGFASCVWHGPERTPSMKFYPKENRVHCFSCSRGGDAIDVCMAVNNVTISEAIRILNGQ